MIEMYYCSLCCLLGSFPSNLFLRSYIYNFESRRRRRGGVERKCCSSVGIETG